MFRGWQCGTLTKSDRDGTKAVPFDVSVRTLGLHVTLGNTAKGFCVRHTEERRAELKTALQEVLDKKTIEPKQAERLRGRMQRFEGYAFGRVAQYSLKVLGELSLKRQKQVPLKDKEMQAGAYLIQRVSEARAIDIGPVSLDTFFIFTDGACEGDSSRIGSVGGVLVGPSGRCTQHFSSEVPTDFMREALACSANPIYELKLLPINIALHVWGKGCIPPTWCVTWTTTQQGRRCAKGMAAPNLTNASLDVLCSLKVISKQSLGTQGYPDTLTFLMVQADWTVKRWSSWGRNKSR